MNEQNFNISFSLKGLPLPKKFIDRPSEIRILEEKLLPRPELSERKVFVLRGLGGIGKTQLAVHFMRTYHVQFSAVFWIDGSSEDNLKQGIAQCASRIPPHQISDTSRAYAHDGKSDIDSVVQEVLLWFEQSDNRRWLIVFDNVDREFGPKGLDPLAYSIKLYMPNADHGSILITTRLTRLEQLSESQEVKKVDYEISKAILKSWYKSSYGKYINSLEHKHIQGG